MRGKELKLWTKSKKLKLTKVESFDYWLNFIFHLVFVLGIGYGLYKGFVKGTHDFISVLFLFSVIALIAWLFIRKLVGLKLDVYESNLSPEQFKQANQACAMSNEWGVISNRKDYFSAIKHTDWSWEGLKITAILKNGKLYINSIASSSYRSSPITFGQNTKNKIELLRQYQSILNGENVIERVKKERSEKEVEFWNKPEWTLTGSIKRIMLYLFSILFVIIAFFGILEGGIEGLILGITLLSTSLTYIISDIMILKVKKNKRL
ncbi:hypothetical protein EI427_12970 [Flammeovirga pectinis]|uniref:Uncharacterized protein n=1 Tax=Flammeovirga pectinis TaxID=2494373 RepID=A0A3S9P4H4_9BACT|nr:hypothetical protein [Flammeovirga pectinis]AZQ63117.1 hypothetical protein EI427_12970 [Flammeovirga pectinis]